MMIRMKSLKFYFVKLSLVIMSACLLVSCAKQDKIAETNAQTQTTETKTVNEKPIANQAEEKGFKKTMTGLQIKDEKVGTGTEAKTGQTVSVHYTGTLYPEGTKFDSSV